MKATIRNSLSHSLSVSLFVEVCNYIRSGFLTHAQSILGLCPPALLCVCERQGSNFMCQLCCPATKTLHSARHAFKQIQLPLTCRLESRLPAARARAESVTLLCTPGAAPRGSNKPPACSTRKENRREGVKVEDDTACTGKVGLRVWVAG